MTVSARDGVGRLHPLWSRTPSAGRLGLLLATATSAGVTGKTVDELRTLLGGSDGAGVLLAARSAGGAKTEIPRERPRVIRVGRPRVPVCRAGSPRPQNWALNGRDVDREGCLATG